MNDSLRVLATVGLPLLAVVYWVVSVVVLIVRANCAWFAGITRYGGRQVKQLHRAESTSENDSCGDRTSRRRRILFSSAFTSIERTRVSRKRAFCAFYITGIVASGALAYLVASIEENGASAKNHNNALKLKDSKQAMFHLLSIVFHSMHYAPLLLFAVHCVVRLAECFFVHTFRGESGKRDVNGAADDTVTLFAAVAGMSFYVFAAISSCPLLLIDVNAAPFSQSAYFHAFKGYLGFNETMLTLDPNVFGEDPAAMGGEGRFSSLRHMQGNVRHVAKRVFPIDEDDSSETNGLPDSLLTIKDRVSKRRESLALSNQAHWRRVMYGQPLLSFSEACGSTATNDAGHQRDVRNSLSSDSNRSLPMLSVLLVAALILLVVAHAALQLIQMMHHEILACMRRDRTRRRVTIDAPLSSRGDTYEAQLLPAPSAHMEVKEAKLDEGVAITPTNTGEMQLRFRGNTSASERVENVGLHLRTQVPSHPGARVRHVYQFPTEMLFSYVMEPHYACEILMYVVSLTLIALAFWGHAYFYVPFPFSERYLFTKSSVPLAKFFFNGLKEWSNVGPVAGAVALWPSFVSLFIPQNGGLFVTLLYGPPLGVALFSAINLGLTAAEHRRFWDNIDPDDYTTYVKRPQQHHTRTGRTSSTNAETETIAVTRVPRVPPWNLFYKMW